MDLTAIKPYFTGEKFDNALSVKYPTDGITAIGRPHLIRDICTNKNVLHFGYVAHSDVVDRIKKDNWLHTGMMEWTNRCMGVDIDCEGVELLKRDFGITDAICADIEGKSIPEVANEEWDFALLGEVLEHVHNPVRFLQAFKRYPNIKYLLITVPNMLYIKQHTRALEYEEVINSDHRYSFTPYNLCNVVASAGLHVEDISFCELITPLPLKVKWKRSLYKRLGKTMRYPFYLFKGITLVASIEPSSDTPFSFHTITEQK